MPPVILPRILRNHTGRQGGEYGIFDSERGIVYLEGDRSRQRWSRFDWSQCPLVEVKPKVLSGAPVLRGTRVPVSAIVDTFEYGLSVAEIAEQFEITESQIRAILNYCNRTEDAERDCQ